jgi:ABC-type dipeptide/oligopeptide/nickel transport system permease component
MRLLVRRIALYVVTAVVAITINFFLPRLMPGNPALAVLGKAQSAESPQAAAVLEVQYGVQTRTGMWGQYVQYLDHLLHGNLGTSFNSYPASVGSLISVATQAPVVPLLYGAAWYEYSTRDYTDWPTAANPYIDPVPNSPYMEYTLLHLTPAS